jgi:hypothetical protein
VSSLVDPLHVSSILRRTPVVLRSLLADLDPVLTDAPYGPNTWPAREVVAHLIFGERTDWIPRVRFILAHGDARAFDPFDREGHKNLLAHHSLAELLDLFERERSAGLDALAELKLTEADLARTGHHPALGTVTLGQLLATWVVHDLNHISQISKVLAYQYREEVGAWQAYLSILAPPNPR